MSVRSPVEMSRKSSRSCAFPAWSGHIAADPIPRKIHTASLLKACENKRRPGEKLRCKQNGNTLAVMGLGKGHALREKAIPAQDRPIAMLRGRKNFGSVLALLAGLCLPMGKSAAQSATTATPRPKTYALRKKAAPDPPAPQTPAPPPTLEQTPPTPPQISYKNGQLTIIARNATLFQVLRSVQSQTGASIDMPSSASSDRVVGQLGPGRPHDVLLALLNGSKFNYIILGVAGNPGAVQKVILTPATPASPVNMAQNNPVQPPGDEDLGESEPQPGPQQRLAPQPGPQARPGHMFPLQPPQTAPASPDNSGDNTQPNGAKTPEQLSQELQQMQQQQQQMLEQLNPANRKPQQ